MKNKFLTASENMSPEYCCTVVRLGEIQEIPGAKTVAKTLVNGRTIVIGKNQKEGDVMVYVSNESELNRDFLSVNNMFQNVEFNANAIEVQTWLEENKDISEDEKKEYLQQHRGYFDDKGRVRMKKLAGEVSMGILLSVDSLKTWCPMLDVDFDSLVGYDFDTLNGELMVKAYVPKVKQRPERTSKDGRRNKKLLKYDRLIPGQFSFHYDTNLFEKNVHRFKPEDIVTITNKLHGTSYIIGNVLVNKPKWSGWYEKIFLYLPKILRFTKKDYDVIYSSRSVIKNSTINNGKVGYSAGLDACFNKYYELLKEYIPQGITIYGEIFGYCEGSNSFIQTVGKGYDYRCNPGENKLMIYRVSVMGEDGIKRDMNVLEVKQFTEELIEKINASGREDIAKRLHPIDIFYHGRLGDLYPDIQTDTHWHENLLERMKNDKDTFGMEMNEPMCRNAVPREGIVLRIQDDPVNEAFKLKCLKFLGKEAQEIDKGIVSDEEMIEKYSE